MNSTFPQSHLIIYLKTLTTESLDKWSEIEDALRERKNVLKQEFRETKALEKALAKAEAKAKKDAEKAQEKAKKDAEKTKKQEQDEYLKILQGIHGDTPKTKVTKSTKTQSSYKNYSIWTNGIKGQDNAGSGAPTQKELDASGGRREWKKIQWGILTKEQKDDPTAPWNSC